MSDRTTALGLLAVCGFLFWHTYQIRKPPFAAFEAFDASTFPRIVIAALALFSLVLLVRGSGVLIPRRPTRADLIGWLGSYRFPLISLALFALYAAVMPAVGWFVDTAIYLIAMQLVLQPGRGRRLAAVLAGSAAFTWALGLAFERFLHIVLPRASLF
ncbi:MAG TPA: tripartite tricarboxylate transporter TctB family protein [Candidatus Limnocylindria bacterium]|nr:tripartite tricarboxylate transporter TctB family protein [Candidatus Limnocylindria bacterium]